MTANLPATQTKNELSREIADFAIDKVELLKNLYFKNKGASNEDFLMFMHICKHCGLDPTMKQIYPVLRKDNKENKITMTVQTGIDGYRLIAERTGKYAPGREPTFTFDDKGKLISATAYVKKQTQDGSWHEVAATAFYSEYVQTKFDGKPNTFWAKMPNSQTAKCAEALALRKAFPANFSSVYTHEEMQQASNSSTIINAENLDNPDIVITPEKIPEKLPETKEEQEDAMLKLCGMCAREDEGLIYKYINMLADTYKQKTKIQIIHGAINQFEEKFQPNFNEWKINQLAEGK